MGQLLWVPLDLRNRLGSSTALGKIEFAEYFPPISLSPFLGPFSFSGPISLIPSCQPQVCPTLAISALSCFLLISTLVQWWGLGPAWGYVPAQELWAGATADIPLWGPFYKDIGCVTQDELHTLSSCNKLGIKCR